ncbi:MAG: agmatine deiminase family protein [Elusimicrobiota bacterium]
MKKRAFISVFFIFYLVSFSFSLDLQKPLPNWIDPNRETPDGKGPFLLHTRASVPSDFRIPAEYEPISAVVISWAGYTGMLTQIAKAACEKGNAKVWVNAAPQSISGLDTKCWQRIPAPVDTVWVRDYGPFGLSSSGVKPAIVDTVYRHYQYRRNDDAVPQVIGKTKNIPVYQTELILDGGNFMIDSYGNLFTTERTYIWNSNMSKEQVDAALKSAFKAKNIYVFEYAGFPGEPKDGTGHIDMFMKLLNDHTVLISTAEQEPFKSNSQKAIEFFKNKTAPDGHPYKIITVKGWYDGGGWYSGTWYTYTNSLIVNSVVIMPSYSGHDEDNIKAENAYKQGIPGISVVQVNSDDSITSGGSIHCVTQTIPKYQEKRSEIPILIDNLDSEAADMTVEDSSFGYDELVRKLTSVKF